MCHRQSAKTVCFNCDPGPLCSGTSALSLHPQRSHLLAVGCRDGSVLVLDIRTGGNGPPLLCSSAKAGQRTRSVCAVCWQAEQLGSQLAFQSLSSDGRLLLWTLATAELRCQVNIAEKDIACTHLSRRSNLSERTSLILLISFVCRCDIHEAPMEEA